MTYRRIDLVLPVDPTRFDDDRRMRICLTSLARYLDPSCVERLLIVIPDDATEDDIRLATWDDRLLPFSTEVIHDRELLGQNACRTALHSWYTQQWVKIAAAKRLSCDFYITLDSDVILTKPTSFDDLILDGRAATRMYSREWHASWWVASAELLGTEPNLSRDGMGVTPAILSRENSLALMHHLEQKSGEPWYRAIVDYIDGLKERNEWSPSAGATFRTPTEYTLYYLFAEMRGTASKYHVESDLLWNEGQVFTVEDMSTLVARIRATRTDPGRFLVLQSTLGLSPEQAWEAVRALLEPRGTKLGRRDWLQIPRRSLARWRA